MKSKITFLAGGVVIAGAVLSAAIPASATVIDSSTVCTTDNPFNPDYPASTTLMYEPVPIGCDLHNSAPFSFVGVLDGGGGTHNVTVDNLVFFRDTTTPGTQAYISGTYDGGTSFSLFGSMDNGGVDPTFDSSGQGIGFQMAGTLPQFSIFTGDPNVFFSVDSGTPFTWTITDIGGGQYTSDLQADFTFQMTADGGTNFTAEDPPFSLENLAPGKYPEIDAQLAKVPEPSELLLFGTGFAGLMVSRRRKRKTA